MNTDQRQGATVLDTSERRSVHFVLGQNGTYIRLSPAAYYLIGQVREGVAFSELAADLTLRGLRPVSTTQVESAYREVAAQIAKIEKAPTRLPGGFWGQRPLLPARLVVHLASYCAIAFHPVVVVLLCGAILLGGALALRQGLHVDLGYCLPAYGLFLASLIFHELGHASACRRYGGRPGQIGFTCYLIYPAFYSDVTAAWALRRWQRVVVDLAGVYFELACGAAYAFAFVLSGWEPLRVALLFIAGSCLSSLNPFFKFDGYWVVADALGVTNLRQVPWRLMRRLASGAVSALPWPRWVIGLLASYTVLCLSFWAWVLWALARLLAREIVRYPTLLCALARALKAGNLWAPFQECLASTFILLFGMVMLWRLGKRAVVRVWHALLGSQMYKVRRKQERMRKLQLG